MTPPACFGMSRSAARMRPRTSRRIAQIHRGPSRSSFANDHSWHVRPTQLPSASEQGGHTSQRCSWTCHSPTAQRFSAIYVLRRSVFLRRLLVGRPDFRFGSKPVLRSGLAHVCFSAHSGSPGALSPCLKSATSRHRARLQLIRDLEITCRFRRRPRHHKRASPFAPPPR
jgi:hypothetical protein